VALSPNIYTCCATETAW